MSTSIPSASGVPESDLSWRARRLVRGRESDPWWSRPGLVAVTVLAAVLTFWSLTISGYANSWYSGAALAATQSWHALFFNAADASGLVSLDKGPLSDWMMGLSGRIFGFSSFSLLLPDALCGVAAVVLLHNVVRRTLGHRAALLAALMLAVSPVSVVMARYDNPDALLALLLVAAAWALVRAIESDRLRDMLLCGLFVGLAFNTKMLEAYIIVPGLAVAYLVAARGGVWRRLSHLLAGGVTMAVVSFAWFGAMTIIPAADRPYVTETTNNSWFTLIFGYNGLSRLTGGGRGGFGSGSGGGAGRAAGGIAAGGRAAFGEGGRALLGAGGRHAAGGAARGGLGGAGGFGGGTGPLRLFTGANVGGQIAWLLPLALVGLVAGVWLTRRAGRGDRRRAALILFGLWALVGFIVFSFSKGTFHPYYTNSIAPAVAALAAGGAVMLFDRVRRGWTETVVLGAAVAVTAIVSFIVLGDTSSFVPWLRWAVLAAGALAVAGLLVLRVGVRVSRRLWLPAALGAGAIALLGGPVAYSVATVGHGQTGSDPTAGPASADTRGFGGGRAIGAIADRFGISSARLRSVATEFAGGATGRSRSDTANGALVRYLEQHRDGARYLIAADGSQTAAPIALTSRDPVITIGGFNGSDPAPTLAQLKTLIAKGELRYVMLGGGFGGGGGFAGLRFGAGGATGSTARSASASTGRSGSAATDQRTQWVESSCSAATVPGESSGGGLASASKLYLCTPADVLRTSR